MPHTKVVNLRDYQVDRAAVYFSKAEMNDLLSLYAGRVASGEWCDYAIEQRNGIIAFSVFNQHDDTPEFTIAKCSKPPRSGSGKFLLLNGADKLCQTDDLEIIIDHFREPEKSAPKLELIKA